MLPWILAVRVEIVRRLKLAQVREETQIRKLKIGILDLVTKEPTSALYARVMNPNLASIMPQVVGVWCEQAGHQVSFVCFTGREDILRELPEDLDLLFISAFTQSALLAYALSNVVQKRGTITALGGPHARCYPDDATNYFDYVLGFTDQQTVDDVLRDCQAHRPVGVHLSASRQPLSLPSLEERWKFIEPTIDKSPTSLKLVPMIGSLGCPYSCSFCIDSTVDYQPLEFDGLRRDLRFLSARMPGAYVAWHDPNFGVRFDDYLSIIEDSVPAGTLKFGAESSLSLLSEANVKRLAKAGCIALLPGIESWNALGEKSKTGKKVGYDKMVQVADHINMIMRHVPYLQANFVLGLDSDEGPEPFELTKQFIDLCPAAFPAYSLLSAFGEAAPLNLEYQKLGRVLPFPFTFLNNNQAMNVRPKNYSWTEFYDRLIDLTRYSFSWRAIGRRFTHSRTAIPRWLNLARSISSEGFGRIKYHTNLRARLDSDPELRPFFEGETTEVPAFYVDRIKSELGPFWDHLPDGAINHDPNAYLKKSQLLAAQ